MFVARDSRPGPKVAVLAADIRSAVDHLERANRAAADGELGAPVAGPITHQVLILIAAVTEHARFIREAVLVCVDRYGVAFSDGDALGRRAVPMPNQVLVLGNAVAVAIVGGIDF